MSFWDIRTIAHSCPSGSRFPHNGYLEIYLAGGMVGVAFLAVMILGNGDAKQPALAGSDVYASCGSRSSRRGTLLATFPNPTSAC